MTEAGSIASWMRRYLADVVVSLQQPFIRNYVRLAVQDPTITARQSFDFWRSKGAPYHVCWSCLGNEQRETGFNWKTPGDKNPVTGEYRAFGICQWWDARSSVIRKQTGIDVKTADHPQQLEAMYWELSHVRLWSELLSTSTIEEACDILVRKYERPKQIERDIALQVKFAKALRDKHPDWEAPSVAAAAPPAPAKAAEMVATPVTATKPMTPAPAAPKPALVPPAASPTPKFLIPAAWLPKVEMKGIVVHWSAGTNKPTDHDLQFYHILIAGDGDIIAGTHSIADNVNTSDGDYAAHTLHCNTGWIGVSLCGMLNAVEEPFSAGSQPLTRTQWDILPDVLAQLCSFYKITPDRRHVLSHAEVQDTLGIPQRGKWDISRLPFMAVAGNTTFERAHVVGDMFRKATADRMKAMALVA